jgi:hypothetical protein
LLVRSELFKSEIQAAILPVSLCGCGSWVAGMPTEIQVPMDCGKAVP